MYVVFNENKKMYLHIKDNGDRIYVNTTKHFSDHCIHATHFKHYEDASSNCTRGEIVCNLNGYIVLDDKPTIGWFVEGIQLD